MAIINPLGPNELINVTAIDIPVVSQLASIINTLYVIAGGIFGFYLAFFFFKYWENHKLKKRFTAMESDMRSLSRTLDEVNRKLDKALKKK